MTRSMASGASPRRSSNCRPARAQRGRGVDIRGADLGERVVDLIPLGRLAGSAGLDAGVVEHRHQPLDVAHQRPERATREFGGDGLRHNMFRRSTDNIDQTWHFTPPYTAPPRDVEDGPA